MNRRLDLPLHPSWAPWLWERALGCSEAVALDAHGIAAYRCTPDAGRLADALSLAVRANVLRL